ncbi:MAG: hypothetical protein KDB47_01140 [Mycobacterium sp.]|nr:hypothetical protein [Mycobacterium sp.]
MSGHPDIGPELRQLAQAILDRLDPAVRSAATMASETLRGPGRCQQVWCPVCALAALISGEQHPLLNVVAEHSVALMSLLRAMAADPQAAAPPPPPADGEQAPPPPGAAPPTGNGRYHDIPIVVEPETGPAQP